MGNSSSSLGVQEDGSVKFKGGDGKIYVGRTKCPYEEDDFSNISFKNKPPTIYDSWKLLCSCNKRYVVNKILISSSEEMRDMEDIELKDNGSHKGGKRIIPKNVEVEINKMKEFLSNFNGMDWSIDLTFLYDKNGKYGLLVACAFLCDECMYSFNNKYDSKDLINPYYNGGYSFMTNYYSSINYQNI